MKKIIDRYTGRLIKENFIYLVSAVVFIFLTIFILPGQILDYQTITKENKGLAEEIAQLERKRAIVASFDEDEIDQLIATLNTLLPQSEDYYSIFYALGAISQQTNFVITGLSIVFDSGSPEELVVEVATAGSPEAFITFLENYTYKSGRLITMDSIDYDPVSSATSLSLHFHSKKIVTQEVKSIPVIDKSRFELTKRINADLNDILIQSDATSEATDYPVRKNPFGLD